MIEDTINQAVEKITAILQSTMLDDKNLWDASRCAAYLGYSKYHFIQRIASRPDFPAPINLPTGGDKHRSSRWQSKEVKDWALKFKTKKEKVQLI